jgi:hypothetical protein
MPYRPKPLAETADRFHLTPLFRVMTSPQDIYVLALTEKEVRLVRAFVDLPPMRITIPDLPNDVEEVARRASIRERNQKAACKARKPPKFLLHKFARRGDQALHGVPVGESAPLVLAADEPLASMFRSINTYPGQIDEVIPGNPRSKTDAQLEDAALPMLDRVYWQKLPPAIARLDELKPWRATTDVSFAAHAVTPERSPSCSSISTRSFRDWSARSTAA